jgi:hypothetical protein
VDVVGHLVTGGGGVGIGPIGPHGGTVHTYGGGVGVIGDRIIGTEVGGMNCKITKHVPGVVRVVVRNNGDGYPLLINLVCTSGIIKTVMGFS